jgi:predicted SnoaL-like aldol condensation-catalyzing enzyme
MVADTAELEENKRVTVAFYQKALFEGDVETAISLYAGKTYRQHTPLAADGVDGLRNYIRWIGDNCPSPKGEIKRVFAEGEFVILHVHWTGLFGESGDAVIDLFRLEDGKLVEHWDVIQPIPKTSLNENTMF